MIDRRNGKVGELYALARQEVRRTARGLPAQDFEDAVQAAVLHMLEREHLIDNSRSESDVRGYRRRVFRSGVINFLTWRAKRLAEWPAGDMGDPADDRDPDATDGAVRLPGKLEAPTSPPADNDFETGEMHREFAEVLAEAERRLSPRELELLRDRLGVEPMSESLASVHYGTRGQLAFRGRKKLNAIADDLGVKWLDGAMLYGLFAA